MDDNVDRKTKENDKIYKIIFEKKNTRTNIRMGINLGIIVIIALIVLSVFLNINTEMLLKKLKIQNLIKII